MSSLLSTSPRNAPSASSTADKLKSFGLKLNRGFGIAKRWTLEKVGARESEQEAPEVQAVIAAFQQDKADLDELRAKVQQMIATERSLLDADKSFAQQLAELQIAAPDAATAATSGDGSDESAVGQSALSTIDAVSSAFAAAPTGSTASSATSTDDTSTTTTAAPASAPTPPARHPPFTPATFSAYLTHLHAAHSRYIAALSSSLLDPIDLLLTQDVSVCQQMVKQLPLLRLDHAAKQDRADRAAGGAGGGGGEVGEEVAREEKESREVYEAQLEVVEKLARDLHVKLDRLLQELCERYVTEAEQWYASTQAVIEEAVRDSEGRMQPVAVVLEAEPTAVKDVVEAVVEKLDQLGGQMIDVPAPGAQ